MLTQSPSAGRTRTTESYSFSTTQLVYVSAATGPLSNAQLQQLLAKARSRNEELGVTGLLLYHDGSFLQLLEGDPAAVDATFERIERDPRHTGIDVLLRARVQEREFKEWSMGYIDAGALSGSLEGYIDYSEELCLYLLDATRGKRLLKLFREGSLRQSVQC